MKDLRVTWGQLCSWNGALLGTVLSEVAAVRRRCEEASWQLRQLATRSLKGAWEGYGARAFLSDVRALAARAAAHTDHIDHLIQALGEAQHKITRTQTAVTEALSRAKAAGMEITPSGEVVDPLDGADATGVADWERRQVVVQIRAEVEVAYGSADNTLSYLDKVFTQLAAGQIAPEARTNHYRSVGKVPVGKSATYVQSWWASLGDAERSYVLAHYPQDLGNLDGIPYAVRDRANIAVARHDEEMARAYYDPILAELSAEIASAQADLEGNLGKTDREIRTAQLGAAQLRYATITANLAAYAMIRTQRGLDRNWREHISMSPAHSASPRDAKRHSSPREGRSSAAHSPAARLSAGRAAPAHSPAARLSAGRSFPLAGPAPSAQPRQLLVYRGPNRARTGTGAELRTIQVALAQGNVDTASSITIEVGGMTTNVVNSLDSHMEAAGRLAALQQEILTARGETGSPAVVTWFDYAAPQSALDSSLYTPARAREGGVSLARFAEGIAQVRGEDRPRINLLGHSYGSVTASAAAERARPGVVDTLVVYGTPGVVAEGWDMNTGAHGAGSAASNHVLSNKKDIINVVNALGGGAVSGGHTDALGFNPRRDPDFTAHHFSGRGGFFSQHSEYLENADSPQMRELARITTEPATERGAPPATEPGAPPATLTQPHEPPAGAAPSPHNPPVRPPPGS
ncbi:MULTISPECIES: alpha/beta hydrolase [Actinotignum]|uniref:alpha/beta hydrolase n=1 Tax=Actinotignum TaxID=1653174 RepID=UPI00254F58CF|nr:alpha/beta hydrolase [Actinotignum schaalii]MDE1535769.1 alpha/beta hydrolase [Actinotignum schaalii]MDK7271474.1 alpha/beta hydrolase [Actinotignum schaalii]